jgi:ASC-1-like (ASCH) protein
MSDSYEMIVTDSYEMIVTESIKDSESTDQKSHQPEHAVHLLSFRELRDCPLYDQIIDGKKKVEGRENSKKYQNIRPHDIVLFSDKKRGILECQVTDINLYADVAEFLTDQGIDKVFGNTTKCRNVSSIDEGVKILQESVTQKQILELKKATGSGYMGIGIKFIHEYKKYYEDLNEPWFSFVRSGKKIAEGRLNKTWVKSLNPYDMIEFTKVPEKRDAIEKQEKIEVLVTCIKPYNKFIDLFDDVGLDKVLPGKKTYDQGVAVYRQWYSEDKEKELGVKGIFLKVIKS